MARVDATLADEGFSISTASMVAFASALNATTTEYDWTTTDGSTVYTDGTGYTYDSSGRPNGGTVTRLQIQVTGNASPPDIDFGGIALPLSTLAQVAPNADQFANTFWRAALRGSDLILAPNNQNFTMAGDARGITGSLVCQNDQILGGTGGSGLSQSLYGDFVFNQGTALGGDDHITGRGTFNYLLSGDGSSNSGSLAGGNDVLVLQSAASGTIVGDVMSNFSGAAFGGDDDITGSDAGNFLYGDISTNGTFSLLIGGDDLIRGRGGADYIYGDNAAFTPGDLIGGDDRLFGDGGDDAIWGNGGSDYIDGGADSDTAYFFDLDLTGHALVKVGGVLYVSQIVDQAVDTVVNVETISTDAAISVASIAEFGGLNYVASHLDLVAAFRGGTADSINQTGGQHFAFGGYFEGRLTEGLPLFDAQAYVNNYADLRTAFGTGMTLNANAATLHFINNGSVEGRLGQDALAYIASHADLRSAFGTNQEAGAAHYKNTGRTEGRQVTFDAQQYIDNYSAFAGLTLSQAARHFIQFGAAEGRTDIDPLDYVASYADLIQAFGDYGSAPNAASLGRDHYVSSGRASGRTATFDAWQYLENYDDLT
ncbi:MAG TPA: hypothetical protein VGN97_21920, partial [Mesorhizobium sp.]|nr:hypothetical protein [Mesorhizobium sp.]